MSNDDSQVKAKLLSPSPVMNSVVIRNEKESDMDNDDQEPDLSLHDAVYLPDSYTEEDIQGIVDDNPELVYVKDDEGRTPLHSLALAGDEWAPRVAKLLLGATENKDGSIRKPVERSKALDLLDDLGYTPLHYAAKNLQFSLVETLLGCGADPFIQNAKGNTPLHFACEGNSEKALQCAKEILKYNEDGSFLNCRNGEELTPLHLAVREEAVDMVDLLLDDKYKFNMSAQDSSGNTLLHFICFQKGEPPTVCEIARKVTKKCSQSQLNQHDTSGRTALHLAAIERLPKVTKILVEDERMDVMRVDERKRTALHYAAENGRYPKGHQCVENLLTRKFKESEDLIRYLYQMDDDKGNNPFMLACLNCPVPTVQKYLSVIPEPRFWLTETSMILIYKESPLAIKALMDKAFSEKPKSRKDYNTQKDIILADFGPITGYVDPVVKSPQQETKYLKQSLWWNYDTQKEVLMHPLVQLFVFRKFQKLRAIIYGWIFWQLLWLTFYTLLALSFYCGGIDSKAVALVSALFMFIYIVASIVNETFEVSAVGMGYILSVTNMSQLVQIVIGIIAIYPVLLGYEAPALWQKHCAAMGILLAYILSMRDVGKLADTIGLVVEILKHVVIQIVKVLLSCFPLLLGFTIAFIILFDDEESINTAFPGPLVKVLVMMTGEFEYNDTFNQEAGDGKTPITNSDKAIRLVFFLSFLIAVPVAFFNLLTGFALDKVMELQERAKVGRTAKQIEHIYFIESILLSLRLLRKFFRNHETIVSWLREKNVTTANINGIPTFETLIQEESGKKMNRKPFKGRRVDWSSCIAHICGNDLPSEIHTEIFRFAAPDEEITTTNSCCGCNCHKM